MKKKCSKCSINITDKNYGRHVEAEELPVCNDCYVKHLQLIIKSIESFRKTKAYQNNLDVRNKLLWLSGKMGNWHDSVDGSSQENIYDNNNFNIFELQLKLTDEEVQLVDDLLDDENDYPISKELRIKLDTLREELEVHHTWLCSAINFNEFIEK